MRTVRDNIKLIIEINETVYNKNMQIEYLIGQRSVEGLSNEEYTRISEILNKQEREIDRIRHFVGELVETFVGEGNYSNFMGENNELSELGEEQIPRSNDHRSQQ